MKRNLRRGRPTGDSGDRKTAISAAAKELFSQQGFDNTSIREIALRAGVDPRLVTHYFGSKAGLFAEALTMPPQAQVIFSTLNNLPFEQWGQAIADILLDEDDLISVTQMVGVIKSASADESVADTIRTFYLSQSLEPAFENLGLDNAKVRASAMSSLLAGFTFSDQIIKIPLSGTDQYLKRKLLIANLIQIILSKKFD